MKRILVLVLTVCLSAGSLSSIASPTSPTPTVVIQVPQAFYAHPVHLLHPFMTYWHDRADAAQAVGIASFQAQHYLTDSCDASAQGQALVVLEPNLFFNPQMGVFYSEITARIYTQNSAESALTLPALTLKSEGKSLGSLSYNTEVFTHRAYQQAFDKLLSQLQQNSRFQQVLAQAPSQNYQALCTSIDRLSQPRLFY